MEVCVLAECSALFHVLSGLIYLIYLICTLETAPQLSLHPIWVPKYFQGRHLGHTINESFNVHPLPNTEYMEWIN